MTHKERLDDIINYFIKINAGMGRSISKQLHDTDYLIRRVQVLTQAIEFYANGHWNGDVSADMKKWDSGQIAHKALEEE